MNCNMLLVGGAIAAIILAVDFLFLKNWLSLRLKVNAAIIVVFAFFYLVTQ